VSPFACPVCGQLAGFHRPHCSRAAALRSSGAPAPEVAARTERKGKAPSPGGIVLDDADDVEAFTAAADLDRQMVLRDS